MRRPAGDGSTSKSGGPRRACFAGRGRRCWSLPSAPNARTEHHPVVAHGPPERRVADAYGRLVARETNRLVDRLPTEGLGGDFVVLRALDVADAEWIIGACLEP